MANPSSEYFLSEEVRELYFFPLFSNTKVCLRCLKKNHRREQCLLEVFYHLTIGNKTSIDFTGVKFPQSIRGVGRVCSAVELLCVQQCSFPRVLYRYVKADSESY